MSMTNRDEQIMRDQQKRGGLYKTCMLNNVNLLLQAGESADCNEGYVNIITADPEDHEAIIIAQLWVDLNRQPRDDSGIRDSAGKQLIMSFGISDCLMIGKRKKGLPVKLEFETRYVDDIPSSRYACADDLKRGFNYDERLEDLIAGVRGIGLEKFSLLKLAEPDLPAE